MGNLKLNEMYLNMSIIDNKYLNMELVMNDYVLFKAQQDNVKTNAEFDKLQESVDLLHYIIECYLSKVDKVDMYFEHNMQVKMLNDEIQKLEAKLKKYKSTMTL